MFDHVGLTAINLETSISFYQAVLSTLGYEHFWRNETSAGFGPKKAPTFWLYAQEGQRAPGVHVAFRATDHAAVDAFYRAGLNAGGTDNGAPGLRKDYGPNYYAAFLLDPSGNNIEAVCLR